MKVNGVEITQTQIDVCLERMKTPFTQSAIEAVAIGAGVPDAIGAGVFREFVAHRVADRLIQKERKKGTIEYRKLIWYPVK